MLAISPHEIVVTGFGIVSSIGIGVEQTKSGLFDKNHYLKPLTGLNSRFDNILMVGQIELTNHEINHYLDKSFDHQVSRSVLLGQLALEESIKMSDLDPFLDDVTFICSSTVAGISTTELSFKELAIGNSKADANFVENMDCGSIARKLSSHNKLTKPHLTISTACSSSSNAILMGARLIKSGQCKIAVCGGVDALSRFTINGFNSLKNMSMTPCAPFDAHRNGLNLGEGAAFVVLESSEHANMRNAKFNFALKGYANSNETYHMTGSSPDGDGAQRAMASALNTAHLKPYDIDFIIAHGTSTIDNDIAEGRAIQKLFGDDVRFCSTKSKTGHTLAPSGAISSVQGFISLISNMLIPSVNFENPMPEHGLKPIIDSIHTNLQTIMINSFGFGGNNASLIFSKI